MASEWPRQVDRVPLTASLEVDDRDQDVDVALVSPHLFTRLFGTPEPLQVYMGICRIHSRGLCSVESGDWTIFPVRRCLSSSTSSSIVRIARSSSVLLSFSNVHEVLVLDVQPLVLDHVYIDVDIAGTRLVDDLKQECRQALGRCKVVRQRDRLDINGCHIAACEPVAQGVLAASTQIVLRSNSLREPSARNSAVCDTTDAEDFYSATDQASSESSSEDSVTISMPTPTPAKLSGSTTSYATTRPSNASTGFVFVTQALLQAVTTAALRPKPTVNEDPDCRVFVDLRYLHRIGCFSGDWAVIDSSESVRTAKIYGLPNMRHSRAAPVVWTSSIMLANLGGAAKVRISAYQDDLGNNLAGRLRSAFARARTPPIAQEVVLQQVATPESTQKALQDAILANLQAHFERCLRIVKQGDLLAIGFDPSTVHGDDQDFHICQPGDERKLAHFRVSHIIENEPLEAADMASAHWHGQFTVDHRITRIRQTGYVQSRLPKQFHKNSRLQDLMGTMSNATEVKTSMTVLLHSDRRRSGKLTMIDKAALGLGWHNFVIDLDEILAESKGVFDKTAVVLLNARFERAVACGSAFTVIVLRHIEAVMTDLFIQCFRQLIQTCHTLVATTNQIDKIPDRFRQHFQHEIEVPVPDENERSAILENLLTGIGVTLDVDVHTLALKTAAFNAGDLAALTHRADLNRQIRLRQVGRDQRPLLRDVLLTADRDVVKISGIDFDSAVDECRQNFADAVGAPKIPSVSWADVGGLEYVKDALFETIELPLKRPDLFARGMKRRSGILFYGPPGTGKTLLAKAIATEFSLNFFSVKGPELLNMYIGESEGNVRRVFQKAHDARPCVIFFDELDSVAPKRGNQGDSGGVMDRIVSQLLAELDGLGSEGVFVIGATNRPDLLDEALLRPGRFDKLLYLGVADSHDKQMPILQALTRKFNLSPSLNLRRVAKGLPLTYTGADLYALCSDAMLQAVSRQARRIESQVAGLQKTEQKITTAWYFENAASAQDMEVIVEEKDFAEAQLGLATSVSAQELEHYQQIRQNFEGPNHPDSLRKGRITSPMVQSRGSISKGPAPDDLSADDEVYLTSSDRRLEEPPAKVKIRKGKGRA